MNSNAKLSCAIAAILGGTAAGAAHATDTGDNPADTIQEITVTAQRRMENMQDVPITIQALTADTLQNLHVSTFDDFIKYLPNVTQASNGPGQSNIFMRGLSAEPGGPGGGGSQGNGTTGQFPNVAVYLDDQSASLPGRNLDIYAADLERIEVLEGPQGTLFGSGAEAGMLRYITNKPKLDVTEGTVNAGYSYTAHGDPNGNVDATINLPLIPDTLAVRAVIYDDSRGGYINNVPSTFTRAATDEGIAKSNGGVVPTDSVSINNNNLVANAINPVTYQGFRLSALYKINDDWNALFTQSYQDMNAQGVFSEMPYGSEGVTFTPQGVPIGHAGASALVGDPVQSVLRQGQIRKHRTDRHRQDRRPQARVQRRLPGAQRRSDAGLHELRPRRVRLLLSMRRACRRPRRPRANATRPAPPGRKPRRTPTRATNCG